MATVSPARKRCTTLNVALLAAYVFNTAVTYASNLGVFGATNKEQSDKYQSLVTPAGWAFSIWGLIFASQAAFAVAQALPTMRSVPEVASGAGGWYILTCAAQCLWTLAFAQDVVWLAMALMLLILASLAKTLLAHRAAAASAQLTPMRYLLFHFPFVVHFGWISAASALSVNVTAVCYAESAHTALLALAIASLTGFTIAGTASAHTNPLADPTFTAVVAWALFGIGAQLQSPMPKISSWAPSLVTNALSDVARATAAALVVHALVHAVLLEAARRRRGDPVDPSSLLSPGGVGK